MGHEVGMGCAQSGARRRVGAVALAMAAFTLVLVCCACPSRMAQAAEGTQEIWESSDGINYRIPGIVAMDDGTLLAYCEQRDGTKDLTDINIVMKSSDDRGASWSDTAIIIDGMDNVLTVDNPVMIPDGDRVHLLYEAKYGLRARGGGIFHCYSDDKGKTWSRPQQLFDGEQEFNLFATGPGHGIRASDGTLIATAWVVLKSAGVRVSAHHPGSVLTVYSTDRGETWQLGEVVPQGEVTDPNESSIVELSDGRFLLNSRSLNDQRERAVATSPTGFSGWSELRFDADLPDPVCFGSLARCDDGRILFVNCDSQERRERLTVRVSSDDGATWSSGYLVSEQGGYADMAVIGDVVYVLHGQPDEDGDYSMFLDEVALSQLG